jgi:hypothetical protein
MPDAEKVAGLVPGWQGRTMNTKGTFASLVVVQMAFITCESATTAEFDYGF